MLWYHIVALGSLAVFLAAAVYHMTRLIRSGKPVDYSTASGNTGASVRYSFTGAMSPAKKESAFMHLPTYSAGILYHLGTFLSILMFFLAWLWDKSDALLPEILALFLLVTAGCGAGMLVKRLSKKSMRRLSNPDDYLSNLLTTLFQLATALAVLYRPMLPACFLTASLLLLYFPLGKLKHALYFFAARYHLGFFYGHRGVWPPKPLNRT